jgi:hypothetical protein
MELSHTYLGAYGMVVLQWKIPLGHQDTVGIGDWPLQLQASPHPPQNRGNSCEIFLVTCVQVEFCG